MKMTQDAALQPSLILVLVGLSGDDCVISDKNKLVQKLVIYWSVRCDHSGIS